MIIRVRNKKIIYSIIGIVILIGGFILLKSFAFFDSKYDFNMIKGRVPEFNGGDIQLAFTINGEKSNDVFPSKNSVYISKSVTCSNGVTAEWNNEIWALVVIEPNENKKISCNIDFGTSLYKVVNIGDLVSYTPSSTSYTISKDLTGYSSDQTINPSELDVWRVIKKNEDGTVDMVSEYVSSTEVYFYGPTGSNNLYTALDTIAKQYETEGITNASRYMKNDVEGTDLVKAAMPQEIGLKAKKKDTTDFSKYWYRYTRNSIIAGCLSRDVLGYVNVDGIIGEFISYDNNFCENKRSYFGDKACIRIIIKLKNLLMIEDGVEVLKN